MKRTASAVWKGGLKDGQGTISTESGVLSDTQYSFSTRFEEGIQTSAEVTLVKTDAGFTVTAVHLKVKAKIPGYTPPEFLKVAEEAKTNCPISRLLKAEITMETRLEGWT
jgi:osmotically inducible protein OsmC